MFAADDPPPYRVRRAEGTSPYVLVCEHAGNRIPKGMANLGLGAGDLSRHIAWDIGAEAVARRVSEFLDATLVSQPYSRLVVDCNRWANDPEIVPMKSDGTAITGNVGLSAGDVVKRIDAIHGPFHECLDGELERRKQSGRQKALVTIHSFTPEISGVKRPWHAGVINNRENRLAESLIDLFAREDGLVVGDNEPFSMSDNNVYTVPSHGEGRGIPTVELEIRQDLIDDEKGQDYWARLLGRVLKQALETLDMRRAQHHLSAGSLA